MQTYQKKNAKLQMPTSYSWMSTAACKPFAISGGNIIHGYQTNTCQLRCWIVSMVSHIGESSTGNMKLKKNTLCNFFKDLYYYFSKEIYKTDYTWNLLLHGSIRIITWHKSAAKLSNIYIEKYTMGTLNTILNTLYWDLAHGFNMH